MERLAADASLEKEKNMRLAGYLLLSTSVVLFLVTVAVAVVSGTSISFG